MNKDDLLAALVAKCGGRVHVSASELEAAGQVQLVVTRTPFGVDILVLD